MTYTNFMNKKIIKMSYFSENLKIVRKIRQKSQVEVAKEIGVVRSTIANYESGNNIGTPNFDQLIKIVKFLDTTIDDLLQLTPNQMQEKLSANFVNTGTIKGSQINVNEPRASYNPERDKDKEIEEWKGRATRLEGQVELLKELLNSKNNDQ